MASNKDNSTLQKGSDLSSSSTAYNISGAQQVNIYNATTVFDGQGDTNRSPGSTTPTSSRGPPSPVLRVRQPISHLKPTQTYENIFKECSDALILVLHCFGRPGSGKSQIVRKLAGEFPFKGNSDPCIKWHIQCNDSGHDVKEELEGLAKELRKSSYFHSDEKYQSIVRDIHKDVAWSLAEALIQCHVPVLIIIEDPSRDCKRLLCDFFRCVENKSKLTNTDAVIHIYVTSRVKSAVLSEEEVRRMNCFKMEQVNGFNEEEAIDYLSVGEDEEEKKAAAKVCQRFSGLPLGLQATKAYCKNARISYTEYLELAEESEYEIQESEREEILADYGENAKHVFKALILPFHTTDESESTASLQWKVLSCLSYFHYDRIPGFLIEHCFRNLREKVVKSVHLKADKGRLVSKLLEHEMCTETDKGEITFHEVVVNAFRLNACGVQDVPNFHPLKSAIVIMSGLISKDLRKKENAKKMYHLRRHVQLLLENVEKDDQLFSDEDSFLFRALVSNLYETAAAIMLAESPNHTNSSKQHFEKALYQLWKSDKKFSLILPNEKDNNAEEIAQYVVEESIAMAKTFPHNFILDYYPKLAMHFDDKELKFLKSKCVGDFDAVAKSIKSFARNEEVITKLQRCHLFLSDTDLQPLFLAERMASILHSWSRVVLYAGDKMAQEDDKCMWFSSLSCSISKACKTLLDKSLLSERLAINGGMIPIIIKQKKNKEDLLEAKDMCEEALSPQYSNSLPPMYENGLLKEVYGPSHTSTHLLLLRNLVRIYGRLMKNNSNQDLIPEADKACEDLMKLARSNLENMSTSIMCLIYCGKYYAGKKDFDKAMDCFHQYFEASGKCETRFNVNCWAVYNYGRAALLAGKETEVADAAAKCKTALALPDIMSPDLHEKLTAFLK